jgi:hypothetical protein
VFWIKHGFGGEEVSMRYHAPNDRDVMTDPTPEQLEQVLRTSPLAYWQQGGNGEASLDAGPGGPSLWIKQPEPDWFFVTFSRWPDNWLVPYDGRPCDALVQDERGGDPFWIPRACLVGVDEAVTIVSYFLSRREPSPKVSWRFWHKLPLDESYPRP